jgi:hypothetical protein
MQTNMVCPWRPTALKIAVSFCMLGAIASEAAAQQPTKAQENALRSACRKDFIAHCSKVKPSGPAHWLVCSAMPPLCPRHAERQ